MNRIHSKIFTMGVSLAALGATGCGGESILSAGAKVLGGQISQLTANEIRILNQAAVDILQAANPGYTGEIISLPQAQAVSNFLKVNDLNTIQDFESLAHTAESDPDALLGLDELGDAFENSSFVDGDGDFKPSGFGDLFALLFGGLQGGGGGGGSGGGGGGSGGGTNTNTNTSTSV